VNVYTIMNARLVAAPTGPRQAGQSQVTECRIADNASRKTYKAKDGTVKNKKARFVTLKFWGGLAAQAAKLSKNDVIVPTGELEIETFTNKDGAEQDKDIMNVTSFSVAKSESFFAPKAETEEAPADSNDGLPF
jgi:single-stranded DNA-binding protein